MTSMNVPDPVMSLALLPKSRDSGGKMSRALSRFLKEDPTFKVCLFPCLSATSHGLALPAKALVAAHPKVYLRLSSILMACVVPTSCDHQLPRTWLEIPLWSCCGEKQCMLNARTR